MALYKCPSCTRRIRGVVPKGGNGSAEVFVRHTITKVSNIPCRNSRQIVPDTLEPLAPRTRAPLTEEAETQLSGIRSWFDNGVCALEHVCHAPIMQDDRIVKRGDGWAHVACVRKEHE